MAEGMKDIKDAATAAAAALAKLGEALEGDAGKAEKAESAFSKFANGLRKVGGGISYVTDLTRAGATTLVEYAAKLGDAAANAEDHAEALASLGSAYQMVRQATNDTVSAQQALRVQQALTQSGLRVSGEELAAITRRAREYAEANQIDVTQSLSQLTDALRTGSKEGLQRYGVDLVRSNDRAQGFHRTMDGLRQSLEGTTPAARSLGEEQARLKRELGEAVDGFALAIAKAIDLQKYFSLAAEATRDLADGLDSVDRANAQHRQSDARRAADRGMVIAAGATADALYGTSSLRLLTSGQLSTRDAGQYAQDLARARSREDVEAAIARATGARAGRATAAAASETAAVAAERASAGAGGYGGGVSAPSGGGGGGPARLTEAQRSAYAAAVARMQEQIDKLLGLREGYHFQAEELEARVGETEQQHLERRVEQYERLRDQFHENLRAKVAANDAMRAADEAHALEEKRQVEESIRLKREAAAEMAAAEKAAMAANRERSDVGVQMAAANAAAFQFETTTAEAAAGVYAATMNTMTGSFKAHLGAVIAGRESIGDALKGILQDTLTALAQEAALQAIMETAKGVAKLAGSYGTDGTAAGHFAAAAAYASVAVGAGLGAYGLGQIGGGAKGASAAGAGANSGGFARAGQPTPPENNGGATYIVNINGTIMDKEGTANAIVGLLNDADQRGNRPRFARQAQRRAA